MESVLVLLSTYNGEKYLHTQLDSILNQENVNVRLLVRDDGSKDKTVEILRQYKEKYPNIEVIEGSNLGFVGSFMTLVYEAQKYSNIKCFAFSDQDDFWQPQKLYAAVKHLADHQEPTLYYAKATATDVNLIPLPIQNNYAVEVTKPGMLVRCFMLGCTMAMNYALVDFLTNNKPKELPQMHDLWISQVAAYFGSVIFDNNSYILYRQHGNNVAGVNPTLKGRYKRAIQSFSTYQKRHFREINAKNFLATFEDQLSSEDKLLVQTVANYRTSFSDRLRFLFNKDISMGSMISEIGLKARIILGIA